MRQSIFWQTLLIFMNRKKSWRWLWALVFRFNYFCLFIALVFRFKYFCLFSLPQLTSLIQRFMSLIQDCGRRKGFLPADGYLEEILNVENFKCMFSLLFIVVNFSICFCNLIILNWSGVFLQSASSIVWHILICYLISKLCLP